MISNGLKGKEVKLFLSRLADAIKTTLSTSGKKNNIMTGRTSCHMTAYRGVVIGSSPVGRGGGGGGGDTGGDHRDTGSMMTHQHPDEAAAHSGA